ncbi:unnamed protein product [Gongylonema pulchrum]|uniref:Protein kinase domain-containing protein n=1 Tax=Gongylonema pulchrum TaxID=637853 RepID=A0A183EP89_9BILA|nr:unnamed protein product [Gongylonema pulchrum]
MCVKILHPELIHWAIIRRFDNDQHDKIQVSLRLRILDVQLADELDEYTEMSTGPDKSYTDYEYRIKQFKSHSIQSALRFSEGNGPVVEALLDTGSA